MKMKKIISIAILSLIFVNSILFMKEVNATFNDTKEEKKLVPLKFYWFRNFVEGVEEALLNQENEKCSAFIDQITQLYSDLLPALKKTVDKSLLDQFYFVISRLDEGIKNNQTFEHLESDLRSLAILFLRIDESYFHIYPPVMDYIALESEEIEERILNNKWDEAKESLEEIQDAFVILEDNLKSIYVPKKEIMKFHNWLEDLKKKIIQKQLKRNEIDDVLFFLNQWVLLFYRHKQPLPLQYRVLYADIEEVEESIHDNNYKEALKGMIWIEEEFNEMMPLLKKGANKYLLGQFSFSIFQLKDAINGQKNLDTFGYPYRALQVLFVRIESEFPYTIHPTIRIIVDEFFEMNESIEKGRLKIALQNIREINTVFQILKFELEGKVAKQSISALQADILKIIEIVEQNKKADIMILENNILQKLQQWQQFLIE